MQWRRQTINVINTEMMVCGGDGSDLEKDAEEGVGVGVRSRVNKMVQDLEQTLNRGAGTELLAEGTGRQRP